MKNYYTNIFPNIRNISFIALIAASSTLLLHPDNANAACPANADTARVIKFSSGACTWTPTGDTPGSSPAIINRGIGWNNYLWVGNFAGSSGYNTLTMDGDIILNLTPTGVSGSGMGAIYITSPANGPVGGLPGDGTTSSMTSTGNLTINMNIPASGGTPVPNITSTGIGVDYNGQFIGNNVTINLNQNVQTYKALYSYGVLVGGPVNSGSYNTSFMAKAAFNNLTINVDTSMSHDVWGALFSTSAAIRVISQNSTGGGSEYDSGAGIVTVSGMTSITTAGIYSVGVYVSGRNSLVDLNNSRIVTAGSTSSAIKVGKTRAGGTGGGTFISRGHMYIDTTASESTASILLLGDVDLTSGYAPSTVTADFDTSSTVIKSAAQAINYTTNDKGTSGSGNNISASFNNAQMSTTSTTESLILVEGRASYAQKDAVFNLRGDQSLLTAASDGWLFEVKNYASFTANIKEAVMYGLATTGGSGASAGSFVMNLSDNATWHLAPKGTTYTSTVTELNMSSGATLDASAADFILNGNVSNADSIIDLSGGARTAGQTLTVNGNYAASGNALLKVDTVLGDSSSVSDVLVINNGIVSGKTQVSVHNDGGLGAQTTGDGILVVQTNDATIADGTSFWAPTNSVKAGLYAYNMVRGTENTTNWYLTSEFVPPTKPEIKITPPDVQAPAPEPFRPSLPNIRAEVPVYMTASALANKLALAMVGTYHDRAGEDYSDTLLLPSQVRDEWCGSGRNKYRCPVTARAYDHKVYAGWARLFGETGNVGYGGKGNAYGRLTKFYKNGPSYDYDMAGFQAGMDIYRREYADGMRDIAGLYVGYGNIDSNIQQVYGGKAGTMTMDAYSLGAYWTRKGASGWYIDAVAQGTLFDDVKGTSVEGSQMKTNGFAFTASLEGGYPIALGQGWSIEPQAQLIYQYVSLDNSHDNYGRVLYGDTNTLYTRLGARLSKNWELASRYQLTTWARVNLWHAFGGNAKTSFPTVAGGPGTMKSDLGGTWGSVDVGVSGQVSANMRLFASATYNASLDSGKGHSIAGRLGVKYVW